MPAVLLANSEGRPGVPVASEALLGGRAALDAIEAGIRVVERDPSIRSVGFGGAPNLLGEMELDASIMCGATLRSGAVGALKGYLHPISVARAVMERTPHVMLAGDGAARFAADIGAEAGNLLSEEAQRDYRRWLSEALTPKRGTSLSSAALYERVPAMTRSGGPLGTTCFIARSGDGHLAGGVSTSGWAFKHPGRLGDSPIIGAGLYVDDSYGAAACTQTGEMTVRAGTARSVIAYMKCGASVVEACAEAIGDLKRLRGGYLGSVIVHAMDRDGVVEVVGLGLSKESHYWFWTEGMTVPETRTVRPAG